MSAVRLIFIVLTFFQLNVVAAEAKNTSLVGEYSRGDATGYNVTLNLMSTGKYEAKWEGCLGEYGSASGTWSRNGESLLLKPVEEKDMMKGHLKNLRIFRNGGKDPVFVPEEDLSSQYFRKYGADKLMGFHRNEKTEGIVQPGAPADGTEKPGPAAEL